MHGSKRSNDCALFAALWPLRGLALVVALALNVSASQSQTANDHEVCETRAEKFAHVGPLYQFARGVGKLVVTMTNGDRRPCSALLLDRTTVLTARHCIRTDDDPNVSIQGIRIEFGRYDVDTASEAILTFKARWPEPDASYAPTGPLDYHLLGLDTTDPDYERSIRHFQEAGGNFDQAATIRPIDLNQVAPVTLQMGNPDLIVYGFPKAAGYLTVCKKENKCKLAPVEPTSKAFRHACETDDGHSGGPVFEDGDRKLIGLHLRYGLPGGNPGSALRMSAILEDNAKLRRIKDAKAQQGALISQPIDLGTPYWRRPIGRRTLETDIWNRIYQAREKTGYPTSSLTPTISLKESGPTAPTARLQSRGGAEMSFRPSNRDLQDEGGGSQAVPNEAKASPFDPSWPAPLSNLSKLVFERTRCTTAGDRCVGAGRTEVTFQHNEEGKPFWFETSDDVEFSIDTPGSQLNIDTPHRLRRVSRRTKAGKAYAGFLIAASDNREEDETHNVAPAKLVSLRSYSDFVRALGPEVPVAKVKLYALKILQFDVKGQFPAQPGAMAELQYTHECFYDEASCGRQFLSGYHGLTKVKPDAAPPLSSPVLDKLGDLEVFDYDRLLPGAASRKTYLYFSPKLSVFVGRYERSGEGADQTELREAITTFTLVPRSVAAGAQ